MKRTNPSTQQQLQDDQLLDLLGRGDLPEGVPDEVDQLDGLGTALAAWRRDVAADIPVSALDLEALEEPAAPTVMARWRRRLLAAGAALALAGGGGAVAAAAAGAGPDSPLWPITQLIYPDRAESRVAELQVEELVERARAAADDQRYDDAAHLLEEAEPLIARVLAPADQERLQDEIAQVKDLIHGLVAEADESEILPETPGGSDGDSSVVPRLPIGSDPTDHPTDDPTDEATPAPEPTEPPEDGDDPPLPLPPLPSLPPLFP